MNEQLRHVVVLGIAAVVAIAAALTGKCDTQLIALAGMIVTGEFGLARTGVTAAVRVNETTNNLVK